MYYLEYESSELPLWSAWKEAVDLEPSVTLASDGWSVLDGERMFVGEGCTKCNHICSHYMAVHLAKSRLPGEGVIDPTLEEPAQSDEMTEWPERACEVMAVTKPMTLAVFGIRMHRYRAAWALLAILQALPTTNIRCRNAAAELLMLSAECKERLPLRFVAHFVGGDMHSDPDVITGLAFVFDQLQLEHTFRYSIGIGCQACGRETETMEEDTHYLTTGDRVIWSHPLSIHKLVNLALDNPGFTLNDEEYEACICTSTFIRKRTILTHMPPWLIVKSGMASPKRQGFHETIVLILKGGGEKVYQPFAIFAKGNSSRLSRVSFRDSGSDAWFTYIFGVDKLYKGSPAIDDEREEVVAICCAAQDGKAN